MAQGDREGMETSLKQCQNLLQASKGEVTELRGKLQTAEAQIQALKHSKDELINKLSSAETNIEGLNEQVAELGKSDSLDRARVHHQSVVNGLQMKYDTEILSLKEKQDSLYELVADKEREIKSLRQQLADVQHQGELAQISRAETINRLTKSLEESQRQCHSLLESSVNEELGKTKALLKQKTAAKDMTDEMCQALKEELVDLREQLSMFESASSLGLFSTISSSKSKELHDDSMTDLGIKKTLDFKTPESVSSRSAVTDVPDDYVGKLRMELERCLMSNKTKRSQVAKLQTELRAAKTELNDLSSRCERAEKSAEELKLKVKSYEDEFSPGEGDKISVIEKRLRKEIENLKTEKDGLLAETQDLKHRLEEVASSEEKVNEINRELSAEMSQMIRDYDDDKREGLEKCHEAYMQMVEDAKSRVREEITSAAESERQALVEKYESELIIVRDELRGAWKEVDTAKELYIKLSEEKKQLEIQLREEFQIEMEVEIEKVTSRLSKEKQVELEKLKLELESNINPDVVAKAKEVWLREQEEVWQQRIKTEVEKAKADWLKEQSSSLQDTIDSAIHAAEVEWRTLQEVDKEREIKERLTEVEQILLSERAAAVELEVKCRLEEERIKWTELLEKEKSDVCKEADVVNELQDEKSKLCEENSKLQKDIDNLRTAHAKAEEDMKMDIARLKHELSEVESSSEKLHAEKKVLQDTLRKEFADMQEEMNNLLTEKSKLQDSTLEELDKLRLENVRLQEEKEKLMVEAKAELEAKVKMVVREAEEKFRQELEKTVSTDKDKQQISESVMQARVEKQERSRLQAEVDKLRAEVSSQEEKWSAERETILQEKDAERRRCVEEIRAQCEQDIKQFMENHQHTLTSALKTARHQQTAEKQRFELEIKELKTREQQLLGSLRSTPNTSENSDGRAPSEGETTPGSTATSCDNCEQLEKELKSFKDTDNLEQMRREKEQVKEKLTKYNSQVKKLLQDRQKLQVSVQNLQQRRQLEEQHFKLKEKQASSEDDSNASDQSGSRSRAEEQLYTQLQKTEALVRELEEKRMSELEELRSSLEAEHSAAMETMKRKMVELRKAHSVELDKVQRKFADEKQELTGKIEKLQSRRLTSTPVQTETSEAEKTAILEVRAHYIDAVAKIREDVMKHVTETNLRAAEKIKEELSRGRSSLVLEVKTTCLQVIRNVLGQNRLGTNTAAITNAIERQLEDCSTQIARGKKKPEEQSSSSDAVKETDSNVAQSAKDRRTLSRQLSHKSNERSNCATDERAVSNGRVPKEKRSASKSSVNGRSRKDIDRTECDVKGNLQNGHSYEKNADKDVDQQKSLKFTVGYADDKLLANPVQGCDTSCQTVSSEARLPSSGESLNISDSVYLPLVADITKNTTLFQTEEDQFRFHSLPANPDDLQYSKPSVTGNRDVIMSGALQKANGTGQDYRRRNRSPAGDVYRTRSSSPRPRQREERQYQSASREAGYARSVKNTPVSGFIEDRTVDLTSRISEVTLAQAGHKSVGSSGAPCDSGIGTLGRERRSGSGMAGRRANTLSAPGVGGDMNRVASRSDDRRPMLFRQSSENSLSSSILTQYEDDSSGPSTYRSTVEDFGPLDFDTEGTLTSLGLGQRSPRKYNPVPEKDVPRRRLPSTNDSKEYSWRRSMEAYRETNCVNTRINRVENSASSADASTAKSSSTFSNFNSPAIKESYNQGRESNVSDATDVSYNLRLSSTFDSSVHGAREQLGQSFIPNMEPPRLGGQGLGEAVRRPVPVMGRRVQDAKSALSGPQKS
ncbi:centrosomal protein of 152 kDa-like [Liolophura sinensis]|uniref:centrosomal protein of 152 kDa-like n=1 Tax=Liolophura sinensis TaxID=3198878 RepID=UPI0031585E69